MSFLESCVAAALISLFLSSATCLPEKKKYILPTGPAKNVSLTP